jgi:transposase
MIRNQPKTNGNVKGGSLIVGVDIAKSLHYARILFADGRESPSFKFSNSQEGFASFVQWLRETGREACSENVVIGLEPTGHYWKALAHFLDELPWITLVTVNPAHVC